MLLFPVMCKYANYTSDFLCVRHISPVAYQCKEEASLSRQEGTFVIIR